MYITEYLTFNDSTKVAIRGVMMYREKRDLSEKREGKVLAIWVAYRAFPKRSQRRDIWKRLCWDEPKNIHVELTGYFIREDLVKLGRIDSRIWGYEVRALRRKLGPEAKEMFDRFYYGSKKNFNNGKKNKGS